MTRTREQQGTAAIDAMFARAKSEKRAAFLPYFCIGYPDYAESLRAIESVAAAGVDGFEIGIPFSDPIADGPTIQAATQIALENGTTVRQCLAAVRSLREKGVSQPMLMMGYANPLVAYGTDRFVRDARAAGADGLIVPDLPPEEASMFADSCAREGLALVFFLAPTSNDARIDMAAANATGFIYVVSLTGITGARKELPAYLREYIARLRAKTDMPLVLGFGISSPGHARQLRGLTNGFIVASALIRAWERGFDEMRALAGDIFAAIRE
ncbi:MAG: tryptophan synthase subunit alpha [Chloroflexota bacterium]|nr:tryptophan synthase subunit alpha [Chloroflexota bacterium]MDE2946966.1 tryptophan synthase subunit alpha [Chloroflexota bacterium]